MWVRRGEGRAPADSSGSLLPRCYEAVKGEKSLQVHGIDTASRPSPPNIQTNMNYTDIHFHLLPGIDDGPATLDESVALAAAAVADGTDTVVATPHVRSDFFTAVNELPERVREVEHRLADEGIELTVLRGGELGHDMVGRLLQPELELIAHGPPGGRWLLVESPFAGFDDAFTAATDELRDRGFRVVVAHPERAPDEWGSRWRALRHELANGSVLQVNAWSLAGRHGTEAQAVSRRLVREGRAQLIGSDAHGGRRTPALLLGAEAAIEAGLTRGDAERMVRANPCRLLERGLAAPRHASLA
jgi:protein-tyrosine phosphatase